MWSPWRLSAVIFANLVLQLFRSKYWNSLYHLQQKEKYPTNYFGCIEKVWGSSWRTAISWFVFYDGVVVEEDGMHVGLETGKVSWPSNPDRTIMRLWKLGAVSCRIPPLSLNAACMRQGQRKLFSLSLIVMWVHFRSIHFWKELQLHKYTLPKFNLNF